jgi:hypothetical protein
MKKCLKDRVRDVVPGSNYCYLHQPVTPDIIKVISGDLSFADLSSTLQIMEQQNHIALVSLTPGESDVIQAAFRPVSQGGPIPALRLVKASHDLQVSLIRAEHLGKEFVCDTVLSLDNTKTRLLAFRELA